MAKATTYIQANGKAAAVKGVKATYNKETKSYEVKASAEILKPYLLNKFNMKDMNWETLVRKLESLVAVVEESKDEEPKAEEVAA